MHQDVAKPRLQDAEAKDLTKDYTDSPLHRMRGRSVFNSKYILPPSPVLYISNISEEATLDDFKAFLGSARTLLVDFFRNDRKQAYARMVSLGAAIETLVECHNLLYKGRPVRISFSNKDPSEIKDSAPNVASVNPANHPPQSVAEPAVEEMATVDSPTEKVD